MTALADAPPVAARRPSRRADRLPARRVEVRLTPQQTAVHRSTARFRIVIAGRRSGKTYLARTEIVQAALERPGRVVWYVAPTHEMARELMWEPLCAWMHPEWLAEPPHQTHLTLRLRSGSVIAIKSAVDPKRLVGRGVDLAVLDEVADMDATVWHQALRPALADRRGRALLITTPEGVAHWTHDLYRTAVAQTGQPDAEWAAFQFTTAQAGIVPLEELEAARASMDPALFRQEFEASFETSASRVYADFSRARHVDDTVRDPGGDLLVGMDFNVAPMVAVVAHAVGDELHVSECVVLPVGSTAQMAAELRRRYPARRIIVCPDPSGRQRRTSAPIGQTDLTILAAAGFTVDAPAAAPPIVDRVNAVRALLSDATGRVRLRIHPRATALIDALEALPFAEGSALPDKRSGLDHITDALGYLVWQRCNRLRPRAALRPFTPF